ncbi:MAG: hypothetical protein IJ661_11985 [Lachnospiraceae bacterium]|nr:hypothetical protein [Lachnospiraceae bacterium]
MSIPNILNKYGLQVESIESQIYKVINTDKVINIDKLKVELGSCILIISNRKGWDIEDGVSYKMANVYYILINFNNRAKAYELKDRAAGLYGSAFISDLRHSPTQISSIDTIWSVDELGGVHE